MDTRRLQLFTKAPADTRGNPRDADIFPCCGAFSRNRQGKREEPPPASAAKTWEEEISNQWLHMRMTLDMYICGHKLSTV